jgi:UDP-GlcNAc:undecaprenyl-phosphate GlcNAc-1-phosphate transferase
MAIFSGAPLLAILAATLFGALAGFAPFNFAPARIYLGDAGSMFLGLTLGGISMAGSYTAVSHWGLAAPVLILAVPLFDTVYVMTLRLAHGRNPFLGSPDHLAVRLRHRGWSAQAIALTATVATSLCRDPFSPGGGPGQAGQADGCSRAGGRRPRPGSPGPVRHGTPRGPGPRP